MKATTIALIGCGTMGKGIAQLIAEKGNPLLLFDIHPDAAAAAAEAAGKTGDHTRITPVRSLNDISPADIVIEAATEQLPDKTRLLAQAEDAVSEYAVIATNTSAIPISDLSSALKNPGRFIGFHFMNPPVKMKLVEIIAGRDTSEQTRTLALELAAHLGKKGIVVRDRPGFVVNRILMPMINEAIFALEEGAATPAEIDACMRMGGGQPMGPLRLAEFIGLDICLSNLKTLYEKTGAERFQPAPLLEAMVRSNFLGVKTGRGFNQYITKDSD